MISGVGLAWAARHLGLALARDGGRGIYIYIYIPRTVLRRRRSAKRSSFYSSQHSTQKVKISLSIIRNLAFIVKTAGMGVYFITRCKNFDHTVHGTFPLTTRYIWVLVWLCGTIWIWFDKAVQFEFFDAAVPDLNLNLLIFSRSLKYSFLFLLPSAVVVIKKSANTNI